MDGCQEVLHKVIDEDLNNGMHVAFRVFGKLPASMGDQTATKGSGFTTLVQPLAALNKSDLKEKIAKISPGGQTPIAASLLKVEDDLKDAVGARSIVVLITDGNENCHGDVEAAIQKLNKSEVDVVLNVVGYAISQESLKRKFKRWAELGNGVYYDATDRTLFEKELIEAINVSYLAKKVGVQGGYKGSIDGPPIDVPAGQYSITVDPEDIDSMINIGNHEVEAGKLTELTVKRW